VLKIWKKILDLACILRDMHSKVEPVRAIHTQLARVSYFLYKEY